jgi:hypothetical protein
MQQRDPTLKRFLHPWRAGNGKMNGPQLRLIQILVMVVTLFVVSESRKSKQKRKKQQPRKTFHENPAESRV